jgi:hypothetical protein
MLNERNQIFWDYYHSLTLCKKIGAYDSVMKDRIVYLDTAKFERIGKEFDKYLLYNTYPNSFYGYIYRDIVNVTDTACCNMRPWNGTVWGMWYLDDEYPYDFENLDSLESNISLWKKTAGCR